MIRRFLTVASACALLAANVAPFAVRAADAPLLGFSAASATAERAREARFDALLDPADQRAWLQRLSARPHHLGSPYDADNAQWLLAQFRSFGLDARIDSYDVLFPTPKRRLLELVAPQHVRASLQETPLPQDRTSALPGALPTYNAYSPDGDVTGRLVYVNYGLPADYDDLARHGISVKGAIVIARYGNSWRGIKPKAAAEHGAIGAIMYSDPRDDGYGSGDTYPTGVARNATSVQRGSVQQIEVRSGDPSRPASGTAPGQHTPVAQIKTLAPIPVLPISMTDALPLLRALDGPAVPAAWRGGLPLTYHFGGGAARVHLALAFDWKIVRANDIIGVLPGTAEPDIWIVRGNHHDGWVFGAEDPLSGAVALMAEAKAAGALAKAGDRPRRTIVYCLWDGEEPGLLGSTAFVESHLAELDRKAAIYINSDGNGRGTFDGQGAHSLQTLAAGVTADLTDPERHVSVQQRMLDHAAVARGWKPASAMNEDEDAETFRLGALGSGSDFTPWEQHAGIAALNIGYGGEDASGSYHSIFDSFDEYTRLKDGRDFAYGVLLAKTGGRFSLRAANADVLPFQFSPAAATYARYAKQLAALLAAERKTTEVKNALVARGAYLNAADPREPYTAPTASPAVPQLDFSTLDAAVAALQKSAAAYDAALAAHPSGGVRTDTALAATERALLGNGLPRRPWYRNELYAPGFYTGYAVKTMPAIREAIEEHDWDGARAGITSVSAALDRYRAAIDAATAALSQP